MEGFTLVTREGPYRSGWRHNNVTVKHFTGSNADSTEIAAAAEGYQHWVVDGWVEATAADTLIIKSASTEISRVPLAAVGSWPVPENTYSNDNEALNIDQLGASATVSGWIAYATIGPGDPLQFL